MDILNTVFAKDHLAHAWKIVKQKGSGGGIDNVSIAQFDSGHDLNLNQLYSETVSGNYIPEPYKRIYIEKKDNEFRPLSMLTIRDKILQLCVKFHYDEKIDKSFCDSSYAYRFSKSHNKSINRIRDYLQRKNKFVLPIDIDNYFDTINRDILYEKSKKYFPQPEILRLIEMWVRIGFISKNGKYIDMGKGIPQGGILSPLLSNIYLNDYDKEMKALNYINVRYADNIILIGGEKDKVEEALKFTINFLREKLMLRLNKDDFNVINSDEAPFTFCGIEFFNKLRKIDPKKIIKIKSDITRTIVNSSLAELSSKINKQIEGLNRYYLQFDTADQLGELESLLAKELKGRFSRLLYKKQIKNKTEAKEILNKINFISPENYTQKNIFINEILSFPEELNGEKELKNSINRGVYQKRRQYQKVWYESLDIMVSGAFSQIGKSGFNLTIKKEGKITSSISADKIKSIMVNNKGVTITYDAVKLCAEKNIRVNYFDGLGKPFAFLVPAANPLLSITDKQTQAFDGRKAKYVALSIIDAKIRNQASVIKYFSKNKIFSSEEEIVLNSELKCMEDILIKIKEIDLDLPLKDVREKLMGYEGSAAAAYWHLIKIFLPSHCNFDYREHRDAKNPVNIMLNYSYGILYSRIINSITVLGLNPSISFLHSEQKNKPTLAYDLIEPFRAPVADRTVIAILNKGIKITLKDGMLSDESRKILAKKVLERINCELKYRDKITSLNDLMYDKVKELIAYLKDETKAYKPYLLKW
ncbi:MAG: CRISPR-associated endonuclease Cas1 [Melioribacteraceae bacterium]|nr:CRISPR-associated endonuclease Cas1 [Melioribacteraceae bacterium]